MLGQMRGGGVVDVGSVVESSVGCGVWGGCGSGVGSSVGCGVGWRVGAQSCNKHWPCQLRQQKVNKEAVTTFDRAFQRVPGKRKLSTRKAWRHLA
eukprot:1653057-Prorocentrum_lima.AAC.1